MIQAGAVAMVGNKNRTQKALVSDLCGSVELLASE